MTLCSVGLFNPNSHIPSATMPLSGGPPLLCAGCHCSACHLPKWTTLPVSQGHLSNLQYKRLLLPLHSHLSVSLCCYYPCFLSCIHRDTLSLIFFLNNAGITTNPSKWKWLQSIVASCFWNIVRVIWQMNYLLLVQGAYYTVSHVLIHLC